MIKVIKASVNAGKTTKAIEIAVEQAKSGKNVLFLNNEETQESLIGKITEHGTDFVDGEILVGEIDGMELSSIVDAVHRAVVEASKDRKIDVVVIDCVGVSSPDQIEKFRSYLKRIEVVHQIDIYFTQQVIRKTKGVTRPTVSDIWKDRVVKSAKNKIPDCFNNIDVVSIDVTKASPMVKDREQTIIYQEMDGNYIGKYVDSKYYGIHYGTKA